ncbi:MAG: PEP-CTERM sorting domain-containing protein [Betaproteobacteria bacterium]|nr:MAG: PEP-CTERM sorting domain-containing protein [Betaproteobacteria bacterium]
MKFSKSLIGIAAFAAVSVANAGPILIVSGLSQTSEVGTTTAVMNNLQALQVAAGNTVTILDTLPVNLAPYSQVWDIRFDNVSALTGAEQAKYTSYLQSGGGLFLMGENSSFLTRDNSILSLISSLGGGSIGFNGCFDGPEVVHAPFTGPNPVTTVTYAASGCFTSKGSGAWITARADESMGAGIAFGVGSLSNAIAGALTTILDVNFMMNQFDLPASQNLTKNLIQFVGNQVNPVPEPGILALLGIAAVGAGLTRKRKSS